MDNINTLRKNYFLWEGLIKDEKEQEDLLMTEWTESFETYFKFKNYMWKIE